jgi:hypothetical protein
MSMSMSRGLVLNGVLALVLVGALVACAHEPPKPDPYLESGLSSMRAWLAGLPRCPAARALSEVAAFRQNEITDTVAVRGHLTLSATTACPPKACAGNACCTNCFPSWVVVPNEGAGPGELAIQRSGMTRPLTAVVQDCKLDSMRRGLPSTEVLVSGFRDGNVILRASLCVIDTAPAPAPQTPTTTTASLGGT